MTHRHARVSPCLGVSVFEKRSKWCKFILIGAIAPASLALTPLVSAADRVVPPSFSINSDTGLPVYTEGLREGFLSGSANLTDANPFNSSPELTLRMGQSTATGADAWADNRTWVYTGQVFTGPNGILSIAANNDDTDWFKINGVVVLNNGAWDVPNATVVSGLPINSWVDFEYRVGNGGGGAGPSAQNTNGGVNWNSTTGVVFSYTDETDPNTFAPSLDAAVYDLGRPTEPLGGGPTLFRYQSGLGFDDDLRVTSSGTITIDGNTPLVTEPSLRLENATAATLTVNDGAGVHKTLAFANGTTLATNTAPTTIAGTSDVRLGRITDGTLTGVRLIAGGPGQLIIDNVDTTNPNDLNGTTLEAGAGGRLTIRGNNNVSPVSGLTTPLTISGEGGIINIGSAGAAQTYNNAFAINESGTLEHTTNTADTIGSSSRAINIASGKTLTVNNTANVLTVANNINGGAVTSNSSSTALVKYTGNLTLNTFTNATGTAQVRGGATFTNLNVTGGRLELRGDYNLTNVPAISNGGTLSLLNPQNFGTVPATIPVPSGNLELVPGAIGSSAVTLTGGTITLTPGVNGLNGNYYNLAANNTNNQNADFFTYESYKTFFSNQIPAVANVLTTVGDTEVLSFNPDGTDAAMYARYGFTPTNNIISRMDGKINILVSGLYSFSTRTDDGSVIFIDGKKVVDNNFYQGMTTRSGNILLTAGIHDIDIGFYEGGGGNGMDVSWQGPGISNQLLSNSVLFPVTTTTFDNPVNVQQDSTINMVASNAVLTSLTVQPGKALTTTGGKLSATTLTLNGAGNYTINTAAGNTFTANDIASNGAAVNITKAGAGVFAIDDLTSTTPQLPAGSTINVTGGALGVLLGGATNPLGSATVTFNGGGVVLSSKNGDQSYPIPTFNGNGSIEARQIASGLAGTAATPINVTITGNLNVGQNQTLTLGTADNYILKVGGTATGTGNVVVNGGKVIDTSGTALQNLNVALNANGGTANLEIKGNAVTLGSLGSDGISNANVTLGTGSGAVTLTFNGAGSGRFVGNLATAGATPLTVVKGGTGSQSIIAPLGSTATSNISAVTVNSGTMELSPSAIGTAPITLSGGTLQMIQNGLTLQAWDRDPNATGAYGSTLDTFASLQAHYASLAAPAFTGNTAADGNTVISYNPGAAAANTVFAIHGYTDLETIEALFTGKIFIATGGSYTFSPRSDDGSTVYIDGQPVSLNNFPQGVNEAGQAPRDGTVNLTPGYHDILMTYNEGGGGHGVFVDITGPDGVRRTLSNSELYTPDVTTTNAVSLTTSSSVDARGGRMALGALSWANSATLTSVSGTTAFSATTLPSAGTYKILGAGSVEPGAITVTGNAAVTLNNAGTGSLILNNTATAQLQNTSSVISANGGGRVVAVYDSTAGAFNPLGTAKVSLGGAGGSGELVISNKIAADFTAAPTLEINGNAAISADNAGGGAASGTAGLPIVASLTTAVPYGANTLTLRSGSNYALQMNGAVTGTGPLNVTGGSVTTSAAVTAGALNVTGGRLTTSGSLTAASATVAGDATLRISNTANVAGGTTVNDRGTLEVNGASYTGGPIALNGGSLEAVGGVTNLSNVAVNGSTPTITQNALTARLYPNFVRPAGGFGTDQGLLNTFTEKAAFTTTLGAKDFNFGPNSAGDAAIASYFGTSGANTGAFTMTFTGLFTAKETGLHSFKESIVDDNAAFWVDLNQNGIFELNGSAGSEKLATQGCCGPNADPTVSVGSSANLTAGQSYRVAIVLEDTGGGGSLAARFSTPSLAEAFINPGTQTGFWSTESGGGTIRVAGESTLTLGVANNISNAIFTGTTGTLRFNNSAARSTTIGLIRSDTTFGANTVDLGANDTLTAGLVLVNDGSIIQKTGTGTLNAANVGLAAGSTLDVNAGRLVVSGSGVGNGMVLASGTGTAVLNGSIAGSVAVDAGGTVAGSGTVGTLELRNGGFLSPGDNGTGNLRIGFPSTGPNAPGVPGDLNLNSGTLNAQILALNDYDKLTVTGGVNLLSDVILSLTLSFDPVDFVDRFTLVDNDGTDPVNTIGVFTFGGTRLVENTIFTVGTQKFLISYVGGDGNDVVLSAVPEPATAATLLGAMGTLIGMQRFRRRKA